MLISVSITKGDWQGSSQDEIRECFLRRLQTRAKRSCKEKLLFCGQSLWENKFKSSSYNEHYGEPYIHEDASLLKLVSGFTWNWELSCICMSLLGSFAIGLQDRGAVITGLLLLWFKFAFKKHPAYSLLEPTRSAPTLTFCQNLLWGTNVIFVIYFLLWV